MTTPNPKRQAVKHHAGERSFTLLETVVALTLMTVLILEVSAVQGKAITFSEYIRRATQASWLAQRVMSQIEYNASFRPLKDMSSANVKDQKFEDFPDYSYDLEVKEWKFPLTQLLVGGFSAGGEDKEKESEGKDDGMAGMIKTVIEQVFGDELLKTVSVTVYWPEGAQRGSVSLAYLLTNQQKIDELLVTMKPVWDDLQKKEQAGGPRPAPTPTPTPPAQ